MKYILVLLLLCGCNNKSRLKGVELIYMKDAKSGVCLGAFDFGGGISQNTTFCLPCDSLKDKNLEIILINQ